MKLKSTLLGLVTLAGLSSASLMGQISITGSSLTYSENFNTWLGTEATIPNGWDLSAAGTIEFRGTGTGTGNAGGFWAFGSTGSWAMGELRSNATGELTFAITFENNTGLAITDIEFNWDYEQWRYANTSGLSVVGLGSLSSEDFSGVGIIASATGTNGTVTVTSSGITLNNLNIAPDGVFGLSWTTVNQAGANSALAINNFSAEFTAIPEPSTYAAIFGGLALGVLLVRRRIRAKKA